MRDYSAVYGRFSMTTTGSDRLCLSWPILMLFIEKSACCASDVRIESNIVLTDALAALGSQRGSRKHTPDASAKRTINMHAHLAPCPNSISNACDSIKKCWDANTIAARRQAAVVRQRELARMLSVQLTEFSESANSLRSCVA